MTKRRKLDSQSTEGKAKTGKKEAEKKYFSDCTCAECMTAFAGTKPAKPARVGKASRPGGGLEERAITYVRWGLHFARRNHPEGANLTALIEEVGELARALQDGDREAIWDEARDVAVIGLRFMLGERAPEPSTPKRSR